MAQPLPELTLSEVMERIKAVRQRLTRELENTPVREWGAQPVRELRNHEQELLTALMVLRDLASDQGAFKATPKTGNPK
ncbi:hypothetical protein [Delftia sp. WSY_7]|uniref:hypothetical protein n=1 Tax=Delftia sp. WSY_7 TaxID=3367202 RepID=UPI00370CC1A1